MENTGICYRFYQASAGETTIVIGLPCTILSPRFPTPGSRPSSLYHLAKNPVRIGIRIVVPDVDTIVDLLLCLTRVTIVHFIGLKLNFDALQSIVLTDEALAHQTSQAGGVFPGQQPASAERCHPDLSKRAHGECLHLHRWSGGPAQPKPVPLPRRRHLYFPEQ